jgi:hypothetical protein
MEADQRVEESMASLRLSCSVAKCWGRANTKAGLVKLGVTASVEAGFR